MVECPTCGTDDFASERSMKSHHTRMHGFKLSVYQEEHEHFMQSGRSPETDDEIDRFAAQIEREIARFSEAANLESES